MPHVLLTVFNLHQTQNMPSSLHFKILTNYTKVKWTSIYKGSNISWPSSTTCPNREGCRRIRSLSANNLNLQVPIERSPACVQPNLTQRANERHCQLVHIPLVRLILLLSVFDRTHTQQCTYRIIHRASIISNISAKTNTAALNTVKAWVKKKSSI